MKIFRYHKIHSYGRAFQLAVIILAAATFTWLAFFKLKNVLNTDHYRRKVVGREPPNSKPLILAWTSFFGMKIMDGLFLNGDNRKLKPFNQAQCLFECEYSDDKKWAKIASMIVFHIRDLIDMPPPNSSRLNVFFLIESAAHSGNVYHSLPPNYFNMTLTYRADSDVYWPNDSFEMIVPDQTPPEDIWHEHEIVDKVKKKTKLVLQLVSNCETHSGRETYVSELKKYVSLTEYGSCSGNKCEGDNCLYEKIDEHMFYLAFENSICKHYVTEKFWYMKRLIVPVVLSSKPFEGLGIPESTYISAQNFDSPQQLSQYLIYLQKNSAEYLKYFEWTKYYKKWGAPNPLCQLCQWAVEKRKQQIENIVQWWEGEAECKENFANSLLPHLRNNKSIKL